jgi:3',5'-cyclic AMP phosphodiesterase CpdA
LGVNMFDQFRRVSDDLLRLTPAPSAVLVAGDCAFQSGEVGDYATLVRAVEPLRRAGLPLHLTLGNHDDRDKFLDALHPGGVRDKPVEGRYVSVVESARANWFLLDSLKTTTVTPGNLGDRQLAWLAAPLDARADKPALVVVHHHPNPDDQPTGPGLRDTKQLLAVLGPRRQVKALIFGHSHVWSVKRSEYRGIHFVNLPPTAYVFHEGDPSGWVDLQLTEDGAALELLCIDAKHPRHGERHELAWRRE